MFVGNSLTSGDGLRPRETFPNLIEHLADSAGLSVVSINAGVSGETTAEALGRIDSLLRAPVDIVVLETGANDGFAHVPLGDIRANIESIIDHVRRARPAARVALMQMAIFPTGDSAYYLGFARMYPAIAAAKSVTLFSFLLRSVVYDPTLMQGDGMHPNAAGERIVAHNVWNDLEPLVRSYYRSPKSPTH